MNESENSLLDLLDGKKLIIGREGHVYVGDPSVSKQHAEISISKGRIRIRDLNSTNGTYIVSHDRQIPLDDGFVTLQQTIMIGGYEQKVSSLLEAVGAISKAAD